MRLFLILAIAHLSYLSSISQINLLPNGGFEELSECPTTFQMIQNPGIELANTWWNCTNLDSMYSGTSDIFNACFDSALMQSARLYFIGNTTPYEGNGFAGIWSYSEPFFSDSQNYFGENISCMLISEVQPTKTYLFSFYISLSEVFANHNLKKLKVAFHNDSIFSPALVTNQFNINSAFPDYEEFDVFEITGLDSVPYDEWIKVETLIHPTKTSNHMAIGTFKSNQLIFEDDEIVYSHNIIFPPLTAQSVYYLIDNISLTEIVDTTSIGDINKAKIKIYPNPFDRFFTINGLDEVDYNIKFYDLSSRLIYETRIKGTNNMQINTEHIHKGAYFLEISTIGGNRILTEKIIK
jgi:hypothetical protein